jgi:hypothetical protein
LVAAALAVLAVGSKESAVFVVPLAAILCWHRERHLGRAAAACAPIVLAVFGWLWWRASLLGTWGSGTHYGWQLSKVSAQSCLDWLVVGMAPVHEHFAPSFCSPLLWAVNGVLLLLALRALFASESRACAVAAIGGTLLLLGYAAGIGLEKLDPQTLENVRYGYEPALGLCALFAIGIASLPPRARGPVLGLAVLAHGFVLDANRESWLRAGAVYRRMEADVFSIAQATQQPIYVLQAPGVYEGAFALLNGHTEFLFMQHIAPPEANLSGAVASAQEWRQMLQELSIAAYSGGMPANSYVVQWDNGALAPFELDGRWPQKSDGVDIGYAWLPRVRPFVDSVAPVHVFGASKEGVELFARASVGGREWRGEAVSLPRGEPRALQLSLPLPADLEPEVPIEVALVVRGPDGERVLPLGVAVPSRR